MTMMQIIEQTAKNGGLSHDSGLTKCHCSAGIGAPGEVADLAKFGSISRRRARARARIRHS